MTLSIYLAACSNDSGSGGGKSPNPDSNKPGIENCDYVITKEMISEFNQKQNLHRISGAGFNTNCVFEENINGKVTRVEKNGYTAVEYMPRVISASPNDKYAPEYYLPIKFEELTDLQKEEILKSLKVDYKKDEPLPVEASSSGFEYLRINQSLIFPLGNQVSNPDANKDTYPVLQKVSLYNKELLNAFKLFINDTKSNITSVELLVVKNNIVYLMPIELDGINFGQWQNENPIQILKSHLKKSSSVSKNYLHESTLDYAMNWSEIDLLMLNQEIPELYGYAESLWATNTLDPNKTDLYWKSLKYIIAINPNHKLAPIWNMWQKVYSYVSGSREALQLALDIVKNQKYTEAQVDYLLKTAEEIYIIFGSNSWSSALTLAEQTKYNWPQTSSIAKLMVKLFKGLGLYSSEIIKFTTEKVTLGLTEQNIDLYINTISKFKQNLYVGKDDAIKTADQWILNLKLNDIYAQLYFDILSWLKNSAYLSTSDSLNYINQLSTNKVLQPADFELLKNVYSWLNNTLYFSKDKTMQYTTELIMSVNITSSKIEILKDLTNYMVNTLYLNKEVSFEKSKKFVVEMNLPQDSINSYKETLSWLINTIYLSKSVAIEKADNYILNLKLNNEKFNRLKTVTDWYINQMYVTKNEGLTRAENFVFNFNATSNQVDLLKQSADWLQNTVYLGKMKAIENAEEYLIKYQLTNEKFTLLKNKYDELYKKYYNKEKALKETEKLVLGKE